MINFEEELKKFNFPDKDADGGIAENEAAFVIDSFNTVFKRLSRDQSNANTQLEELAALMDEKMEKDREIEEAKGLLREGEAEKSAIVKGFVEILDRMEDLYRYATANDYGNWTSQIRLLWGDILSSLNTVGIMRIDGLDATFNPRLYTVKMTRDEPDAEDGRILEVLRCGYIYRSDVIRKADVVVNKKSSETRKERENQEGKESEVFGQDRGDRPGDFDL